MLEAELNHGTPEGPSGRDYRASTRIPYDVPAGVLMVLSLPTISGWDTIEHLRGQGYKGAIVALTADPDTAVHQEAMSKGCDTVLPKPCNIDRLSQELARHLPAAPEEDASHGCLSSDQ